MVTDVMVINKERLVPVKDNSNTVVVMAVVNQPLWNKQVVMFFKDLKKMTFDFISHVFTF